ncbi:MAG TPA: hypothetical protein VHT91_25090 [Kofleriaceae bacterium]|jgi:hypothetical protein|nr:hypothetical protein [Kofleriaceae bacterium]
MRDRTAIEREIFAARQNLEENLDRLVHRARERLALRARARHAARGFVRDYPNITTVTIVACVVVLLLVRRAYRRAA